MILELAAAFVIVLVFVNAGIMYAVLQSLSNLRTQAATMAGVLQRSVQPKKQARQQQQQQPQYIPQQYAPRPTQTAQGDYEEEDETDAEVSPILIGLAQSVGLDAYALAEGDPAELQKARQVLAKIQGQQNQTELTNVM